jgi:hypothetical protein
MVDINTNVLLSDKLINKLYDISTFTSVMENINNLVSNTDFEFKKVALMYPKFINNHTNHLILFTETINKEDKYVKIIEDIKKLRPENEYHIVQCDKIGKKIDCQSMIKMKLTISVDKLPSLYLIISNTNIISMQIDTIKTAEDLNKLID